MSNPVSLQINIAPVDYPAIVHTLPHQLSILGNQCNEICLTFDTRMNKNSKRFSSAQWQENKLQTEQFVAQLEGEFPHLVFKKVDYSEEMRRTLSEFFYGSARKRMPDKDFRGGPFYSYYYGWYATQNDYVLHLDADILLGGGSQTWVAEALEYLKADSNLLYTSPLLGPPLYKGEMPKLKKKTYNPIGRYPKAGHAYLYKDFSTRIFLLNKQHLKGVCPLQHPNLDHHIKALFRGLPPYRFPEGSLSDVMKNQQLLRLDFLGELPGLWSHHPGFTGERYTSQLAKIVKAVEEERFPEFMRGRQDIIEPYFQMIVNNEI
ncbi:MAG: hypothetical protein AAGG68_05465 [Bacteroidota bacterium]